MKRLLIVANVAAVIAIVSIITVQVLADRDRALADATEDVENLRDALREQTLQAFGAVALALGSVAEDIDPDALGRVETHRALSARQGVFAQTYALYVLDEKGQLAATSRTPNPESVDFSNELVFTSHQGAPSQGLFIAPPRKGKVGYGKDRWIFTVSQRLSHADGSFAGVVAAAVSIEYLTEFYDALRMGDGGVVGISKDDATVITRSPFNEEYAGRVLSDTRLFREFLPASDAGVYRAEFVTDGADRIVAYSRVPGFPVVVYVGVSASERLAGWRQRVVVDGALGVLAILIIGGFTYLLARRVRERQREQRARVRQLTKLTEISKALLESPDVDAALKGATHMARSLVPCHQALASLTEHPSMAQTNATVSLSDKYAGWRDYEEKLDGSGIYREVCETNQPMRLTQAELEAHPRWKAFGVASDRHPPMQGWLAVPLVAHDGTNLGLIQLSDRESGEFTAEDQALAVELARMTSLAIEKLEMAANLRDTAAVAERLRKDAERARASEAKARAEVERILTSIRDSVFALDHEWRFTYLNPRAEEVLERSAEDLIGRSIWEEIPMARESEAYEQYHRARDENVDVHFEIHYPTLERWFDVRAFPQEDGGLTVYFQDVSNWVKQEEQLRQAQKMEAIGKLTGGVAHDFNNLLTVILGNAEVVLDDLNEDDPHYRQVYMIGDAAERAADLTRRLLAFSRRQPLDPKAVDVNALIEDLEPLLRRTLGEQYEIIFHCREGIANAIVDPGQLWNAILNLAVNSRDAMPDGGRLVIETTEVDLDADYVEEHVLAEPGRYVLIAVGDTGVGMSADVRSHAFEPFFTTKKAGQGTGLGLSMVFGFIKQSNGHVNIYSEPGEGTTVKLYLPCAGGEDVPAGKAENVEALRQGTERILVVEDDAQVRQYAASTLAALGYDVTAVADGPAACAQLEAEGNFDLLLCDVILAGGMNGRQVAEAAHEIAPRLKVLYMSGYTENVIVHHGRLDPGARLLLKPFRRADLAKKVGEVLDERD